MSDKNFKKLIKIISYILYTYIKFDLFNSQVIYNFTPAPLRKMAFSSKDHLGFAG